MANIPIYIPTYINSAEYTPVNVQPRLLFFNGMLNCESYYIESASAFGGIAREQTAFPYFDNYNVVTGSFPSVDSKSLLFYNEEAVYGEKPTDGLYSDYWQKYIELIYNPRTKLLNASAIIPLADYFNISQNDIVEFRGNYYHLRAINDYSLKNGECSIQLLGPILPDALNLPSKGYPYCFGYDATDCYIACNTACECNPPCPTSTTTTTAAPTTTTTSTTSTTSTTTTTVGPLVIEYIIVAGGGSGGGTSYSWNGDPNTMRVWGGGGGGGQVITGSMTVLSPLTIGVGEGGQNILYQNNPLLVPTYPTGISFFSGSHGSMGFPSYISGSSIFQVSIGGGQGGTTNNPNYAGYPIPFPNTQAVFGGAHSNGGNGGGAAIVSASTATPLIISGGLSTGGGFNGAWSTGSNSLAFGTNNAGGGAGASANGSGANGGRGYQWLDNNYYAGGGAGLTSDGNYSARCPNGCPPATAGIPGLGGGGPFNTDGTQNTGGGGGSSYSSEYPANGGKGVVKIRYFGTPRATGGVITQSGGYTYHTFTSSLQGGAYIVGAVSSSAGITGGTYRFDAQQYNNGNYMPPFTASFIPN